MVQFEQVRKRKESVHFIDYFFVCGLPENENIRIYKHLDECSFSDSHRKRFISSVLCHFPENIPENPWKAGELWKLCTPGGIDIFIGEEKFKPKERFHAFLLTREDGSKYFGHVLTFFEPCINKGQQDIISSKLQLRGGERAGVDGKQIFAEKCIGFITQRGFINTCEEVLHHLFSTFVVDRSPSDHVPIESFIFNLLYEIPLVAPNQGCKLSCLTNAVGDRSIVIQNPGRSELPLLDVHLSQLFRMLGGAANVISLLTSILLEHQILLISKDCRLLMHAGEGITALLFPFQWQHTFVSVLPHDLAMHFFHAPVPYIIGVVVHPDMKLHLRRALEVDQCYVDLDNAQVECPEDQPSFPEQVELCEKLNIFFDRYNNKMASLPNDEPASQERPKKADRSKKTTSGDMVEMKSSGVRRRRGADLVVRIVGDEGEDDDPQVDSLHANVMLTVTTTTHDADSKDTDDEASSREHRFNVAIRETVASCFLALFFQYEKFVVHPADTDTPQRNATGDIFDKTSFISDQPEHRLPFLLAFLDTQMFATFIDNSLLQATTADHVQEPHLRLFNERIEQAKLLPADGRSPTSVLSPNSSLLRTLSLTSQHNFTSVYVDQWIQESEQAYRRRTLHPDFASPSPHPLTPSTDVDDVDPVTVIEPKVTKACGTLPRIEASLLEPEVSGLNRFVRRTDKSRQSFKIPPTSRDDNSKSKRLSMMRSNLLTQPNISEYSPELIARTNWKFVEKLLKDVKSKTKKLLVGKMGRQEAVDLGWSESGISDLEENTWIGGLCDLLERVWSHGLLTNQKKGKSALWSHLLQYEAAWQERRHAAERSLEFQHQLSGSSPSIITDSVIEATHVATSVHSASQFSDAFYSSLPRSLTKKRHADPSARHRIKTESRNTSTIENQQTETEMTISSSMRRIREMRDLHTDVGRSRAWIRLALEQKQLHAYLRQLISDHHLLDRMYKKYSFLQCEDERQQFLYHLLTLNAADFNCFTNSFTKTTIEYRVQIFPSRQLSGQPSHTSANIYIRINGELHSTPVLDVPKNCLEFTFKHQNLGFMTSLIIGHDNAGILPKWFLDYVIVRNDITGQTFFFPCYRSLGKAIDDNSLERMLIAQVIPYQCDVTKHVDDHARETAKKSVRQDTIGDLQERVGHSVNSLIKFLNKPTISPHSCCPMSTYTSASALFCRLLVNGLVAALASVLSHGLRKSGLLRRRMYAWDLIAASQERIVSTTPAHHRRSSRSSTASSTSQLAKGGDWFLGNRTPNLVQPSFSQLSSQDSRRESNDVFKSEASLMRERTALTRLCQLFERINEHGQYRLGKDDMLVLLLCVGIHEHAISHWLPHLAFVARALPNLYEDEAFLCDHEAVVFLAQVLNMLEMNQIPLDDALLRGLGPLLLDHA